MDVGVSRSLSTTNTVGPPPSFAMSYPPNRDSPVTQGVRNTPEQDSAVQSRTPRSDIGRCPQDLSSSATPAARWRSAPNDKNDENDQSGMDETEWADLDNRPTFLIGAS